MILYLIALLVLAEAAVLQKIPLLRLDQAAQAVVRGITAQQVLATLQALRRHKAITVAGQCPQL